MPIPERSSYCRRFTRVAAAAAVLFVSCAGDRGPRRHEADTTSFLTGAERLVASSFEELDGKRVGLVTNHTAMVNGKHLIDHLHDAPNVTLEVLFGPEHGLRGEADAGDVVEDGRDEKTGLPVISLYGERRKPPREALEHLDALLFDIQDVGARFYTYISTMGLAMQAAADAGIAFVVLDRPNPLGGDYTSGFIAEAQHFSFVGRYPVPIAHGLTIGELAGMIKGEQMLAGLASLNLSVIEMQGWKRNLLWPDLGRPWIPTSPNIPDFQTALVYPGTCLFEASTFSEGRGTRRPFTTVGGKNIDGNGIAGRLNDLNLPGVRFEAVTFTPVSIPGMSAQPKLENVRLGGVSVLTGDPAAYEPVETAIYLLDAFLDTVPPSARKERLRPEWMARLAGTSLLYEMLSVDVPPDEIINAWTDGIERFRERRRPYMRY